MRDVQYLEEADDPIGIQDKLFESVDIELQHVGKGNQQTVVFFGAKLGLIFVHVVINFARLKFVSNQILFYALFRTADLLWQFSRLFHFVDYLNHCFKRPILFLKRANNLIII